MAMVSCFNIELERLYCLNIDTVLKKYQEEEKSLKNRKQR